MGRQETCMNHQRNPVCVMNSVCIFSDEAQKASSFKLSTLESMHDYSKSVL